MKAPSLKTLIHSGRTEAAQLFGQPDTEIMYLLQTMKVVDFHCYVEEAFAHF